MRAVGWALIVLLSATAGAGHGLSAQDAGADTVRLLLARLERIAARGGPEGYLALLADSADRPRALAFAAGELPAGATRATVVERDRVPLAGTLPGNGYQLTVDVLREFGARARVATWRLDIKRLGEPGTDGEWLIADQDRLSVVENLYRLSVDRSRQFRARNLTIARDDLTLTLAQGSVFVSTTDRGPAAVILSGEGIVRFRPAPDIERTQVRIFSGRETLDTAFDLALLKMSPDDFAQLVPRAELVDTSVDARELRRVERFFRDESPKSYAVELGDLSPDTWSLLPSRGDLLAEIRTRRYDVITFTRSSSDSEDVRLFQRARRKTIAQYASPEKLREQAGGARADRADVDVLRYDIDLAFTPERSAVDARVELTVKVQASSISNLALRLADSLVVRSVTSAEYGRLLHMRLKNQGIVLVNLPAAVVKDTEFTVTVAYAGRLEPQPADTETIALAQSGAGLVDLPPILTPEAAYLYSSAVDWYPKVAANDFTLARLRLVVPEAYACVASGEADPGSPALVPASGSTPARKAYVFHAGQPVRYLAFVVSRLVRAHNVAVAFGPSRVPVAERPDGLSYRELTLSVEAAPRLIGRGREIGERAVDIALFYQSLLDDGPYPGVTLAVVENDRPGGHSPGYFAVLNEPLPTSPYTWRNDPASFENYPDFFLAHELAHQWWGQAVGWRTYHDQWLSEGFSQYFAALYARRQRGDEVFAGMMRRMRKWAADESGEGPIALGYRLGHIEGDSRVYRALVYDKGALVLHMLREMVGDERFFTGLRRFYSASRFRNVGTADFKASMEATAGRPLTRFFDRWVLGSTLPRVKFSYQVEGTDVRLHLEQLGELFDMPVAVTLRYADRTTAPVLVQVSERTTDLRVPLAGPLRSAEINTNDGALLEVARN